MIGVFDKPVPPVMARRLTSPPRPAHQPLSVAAEGGGDAVGEGAVQVAVAAVVAAGGAGVGVAGHVVHVVQGGSVVQGEGDGGAGPSGGRCGRRR